MNKDRLISFKNQRGFITAEIIVSTMILITAVSAVIMINFGDQITLENERAKGVAKRIISEIVNSNQIQASDDFQLINSTSSTELVDGKIYFKKTEVEILQDYLTKKLNISVTWQNENNSPEMKLTTYLTDKSNAKNPNMCDSRAIGNWKIPKILNTEPSFSNLVSDQTGTYPITKIKAIIGKLFITTNNPSANTKETFFVFDINDPKAPALISKIDNSSVSAGLNDVSVSGNYAYVANGYGANFTNCSQGQNCAQLQIIDIKNTPKIIENFKVPNVTGIGGQGIGESVLYKDGYVYLGLSKTLSGNEFNIIDVRDFPNSPPVWVGGVAIDALVSAIEIKDKYALLATADTEELKVIDISDKSNPVQVGQFNSPTGAGNGKSLFTVGSTTYLGKTFPNAGNDFQILDNSIKNISFPEIGGMDIGSSVNKIILKDYLAFVLKTNGQLEIIDVSDKKTPHDFTTPFTITSPSKGITMDCFGNYLFVGSNNQDKDGLLFVISSS
jgi:hypothetical protein